MPFSKHRIEQISILKNNILFSGRSSNIIDYTKNTIESIAYYPLGTFETEEARL